MGVHVFPRFGGNDQRFSVPQGPVDQITRTGKGIVCARTCTEVEIVHDIDITHAHNLWIPCDVACGIIGNTVNDSAVTIAFPMLGIIGHSKENTLLVVVVLCIVYIDIFISRNSFGVLKKKAFV